MTAPSPARTALLHSALRLEYLTVGWNVVEAAVAITAGALAGSTALIGFGGDSVVESLSGMVLIWRLRAERRASGERWGEHREQRARRLVAVSMWALAAYIAAESIVGLVRGEGAEASPVGIGLAVMSLTLMWLLARAKQARARELHSHALEADATQTRICWQLSAVLLAGLALNAAFGWWWVDGTAALGMSVVIGREGREAWAERDCC